MKYIYYSTVIISLTLAIAGCGKGDAGAAGAAGATIASGITCSKLDSGSGISLALKYESVVYTTGDRFVTCEIDGNPAGYSASQIYKSTKNGAQTGYCAPTADLDTASGGFWAFTSQGGATSVVYTDSGSAHNGYTYTFASADCNTF